MVDTPDGVGPQGRNSFSQTGLYDGKPKQFRLNEQTERQRALRATETPLQTQLRLEEQAQQQAAIRAYPITRTPTAVDPATDSILPATTNTPSHDNKLRDTEAAPTHVHNTRNPRPKNFGRKKRLFNQCPVGNIVIQGGPIKRCTEKCEPSLFYWPACRKLASGRAHRLQGRLVDTYRETARRNFLDIVYISCPFTMNIKVNVEPVTNAELLDEVHLEAIRLKYTHLTRTNRKYLVNKEDIGTSYYTGGSQRLQKVTRKLG
uniref:Uncharacterized protein n=1 Tax=Timema monikensis TaxID=170555 RepID=A0A7R9HJK5_9NEOP|nr:unnamed protein product [Timema monikensis]